MVSFHLKLSAQGGQCQQSIEKVGVIAGIHTNLSLPHIWFKGNPKDHITCSSGKQQHCTNCCWSRIYWRRVEEIQMKSHLSILKTLHVLWCKFVRKMFWQLTLMKIKELFRFCCLSVNYISPHSAKQVM